MITIKNLKDMLDSFSDADLVEAYQFSEDEDAALFNVLGIFRGRLGWVQGKLPTGDEPPVGLISTTIGDVVVFTEEGD